MYTLLQSQVFINCGIISVLDGLIYGYLYAPTNPPPSELLNTVFILYLYK